MKTAVHFTTLALASLPCAARESADYTVSPETTGSGGGRAASADYTIDHAIGAPGGAVSSTDLAVRGGYAGQLFEVAALAVTATPPTIDEGGNRQLAADAVLDDDSLLALDAEDVAWSVVAGPLTGISTAGLATAGLVYQNTPATARADLGGIIGTLALTVLDIHADNFGSYAGDGLDDSWQFTHFGLDNPLAGPLMDPDHDSQDNRFEFIAGLDPTDPLSRFLLRIEAVTGQPTQKRLVFSPRWTDRSYQILTSTILGPANWGPLASAAPSDNGIERSVIDSEATEDAKFYRVEITKP